MQQSWAEKMIECVHNVIKHDSKKQSEQFKNLIITLTQNVEGRELIIRKGIQ